MEVVLFIAVIVVLILVHELGHFSAAKISGMRVDEFGLGYPPRALTLGKWGGTTYTLNWLPFGGFVKIFGEDGTDEPDVRAFGKKNRFLQAFVLVAGVAMNMLFAYVLITGALMAGTPRALSSSEVTVATHQELAVADTLANSPAARAGLVAGDMILSAQDASGKWQAADPKSFSSFIATSKGVPVTLTVQHNGSKKTVEVTPVAGLVPTDASRYAIGVEVATVGVVPVSFGKALVEGAQLTWETTVITAQGLWHFFKGVFTLSANLSQVSGPVGIANAVGSASAQGFGDLLSLMAIISINLALINLIPIPALDGGRLLFVIIEGITRRQIKPSIAQSINAIGFVALILLMLVVTAHDIFKIVG